MDLIGFRLSIKNKFKFEIDFNESNVNRYVFGWGNVGFFMI